jgi:23S rRNA (guanosine2251-2'-O)-methyltransferase
MLIYGKHAVVAALANKNRKNKTLYCTEQTQHKLQHDIRIPQDIQIIVTTNKYLNDLTQSTNHQGIALKTSHIFQEELSNLYHIMQKEVAHIFILDHLEDPQNVGNIIRSAGAFDVDAVIITKHRSVQETPALIKACSGTSEFVPIFVVPNIANIIKDLKQHGFWILGLDGTAKENINSFDMPNKTASIVGSEQSGIQPINKKHCDWLIKIPISAKVESLNAATAAGIIMNKFKSTHSN